MTFPIFLPDGQELDGDNSEDRQDSYNKMMAKKSRTIAGIEISLTLGQQYRASRPMARRRNIKNQRFPVSIAPLTGTAQGMVSEPVLVIPELTYDQANKFLAEFNNGPTSFTGRVW